MDVATYDRISEIDAPGDEHGVQNQRAAGGKVVAERGWTLKARYEDNDIGASKGKPRPGYQAMMAAASRREFQAIVVFHTSRLWRNRRERADGIDILKDAAVSVVAVKGPSLDMTTAYGRAMAGLLGEFDTMESEVKGERQQLANEAAARAGRPWTGCHRRFGYMADQVTPEPAEQAAIVDAAAALLGGSTIAEIVREWNRRGLRPAQTPFGPARPWRSSSIRKILSNGRLAGLNVFKDEIVELDEGGRIGWEPILSEETWRAVNELLDDPGRKPPRGVRTLLGGLAGCTCGNVATASHNGSGEPVYRCRPDTQDGRPGPHAALRRVLVDEHVKAVIIERLSREDVAQLIAPRPTVDTAALHAEAETIRRNLRQMAEDRAMGLLDRAEHLAARERGKARLEEISAQLAGSAGSSALAPFATGEPAGDVWKRLDLARRRAVIDALMRVTLHSAGRHAATADPFKVVEIAWQEPTE